MAISRTLSNTVMVSVLKMSAPASKMIAPTVIAAEIRSAENTCNMPRLAFLPRTRPVSEQPLEMVRQRRGAVGIAQGDDDHRNQRGFLQQCLRDADVHVAAAFVDDVVAAAEDGAKHHRLAFAAGADASSRVADLELHLVGEQRAEHYAVGVAR